LEQQHEIEIAIRGTRVLHPEVFLDRMVLYAESVLNATTSRQKVPKLLWS